QKRKAKEETAKAADVIDLTESTDDGKEEKKNKTSLGKKRKKNRMEAELVDLLESDEETDIEARIPAASMMKLRKKKAKAPARMIATETALNHSESDTETKPPAARRKSRKNKQKTSLSKAVAAPEEVPSVARLPTSSKAKTHPYAGRYLLHRANGTSGVGRLGGSIMRTGPCPTKKHKHIFDANGIFRMDYPIPKHINTATTNVTNVSSGDFSYLTFDSLWQPNGPHYAGQPIAAVDHYPKALRERNIPCPIFMKCALTVSKTLGWEYVGNYKLVHMEEENNDGLTDGQEHEALRGTTFASAKDIPQKCKDKMYTDTKKATGPDGYGRERIDFWKARLTGLTSEYNAAGADDNSLPARALKLGFRTNMDDETMLKLLLELDEYHRLFVIEFVEYDERVYNYCLARGAGKTNKTRHFKNGSPAAKASDWYNVNNS
ncbi:MAG: hypothetical protein SGARI_003288, partial [Bacillariaceae sp.]